MYAPTSYFNTARSRWRRLPACKSLPVIEVGAVGQSEAGQKVDGIELDGGLERGQIAPRGSDTHGAPAIAVNSATSTQRSSRSPTWDIFPGPAGTKSHDMRRAIC